MNDISNITDIELLVNTFYTKVQKDTLIGPIFNTVIKDNWPEHLEKMYRFWATVVLEAGTYRGTPFPPHYKLDLHQEHFNTWVAIFNSTMDALFIGPNADKAKKQAQTMATLFESKINYYRDNDVKPIF